MVETRCVLTFRGTSTGSRNGPTLVLESHIIQQRKMPSPVAAGTLWSLGSSFIEKDPGLLLGKMLTVNQQCAVSEKAASNIQALPVGQGK